MQQALEVDGSTNKSLTDIDIVDDATAVLDNTQLLTLVLDANTVTANDATVTEARVSVLRHQQHRLDLRGR